MVEEFKREGRLYAVIISHKYAEPGISFFTSNDLSQQLAYMKHPAGKTIKAHVHNPVSRSVLFTQETLFIKSGRLRVDFYAENKEYLESRVLEAGDVILLVQGGHGFEVLEDLEMYEVKQGPYAGDEDKTLISTKLPAALKLAPNSTL